MTARKPHTFHLPPSTFHLLLGLLLLCSCSNRRSVNILISNPTDEVLRRQEVSLSVAEVQRLLQVKGVDSLVLLNEKNVAVDYVVDRRAGQLRFMVPVIMSVSQKQYTLGTGEPTLMDNLFRFRAEKIQVSVGKKQ